ncbi:hypothetical protein [Clostridium botulinum]|uniref:hypothetical protein n=1 Tax=Clostridium botulinum TaxID=1491 RepID=UPI001E4F41E3|nr:hypothetical protein [Clostridium botulinum]
MGDWIHKLTGQIVTTDDEKLELVNKIIEDYRKQILRLLEIIKELQEKNKSNLIYQESLTENVKKKVLELRNKRLSYRQISKSSVGNIVNSFTT